MRSKQWITTFVGLSLGAMCYGMAPSVVSANDDQESQTRRAFLDILKHAQPAPMGSSLQTDTNKVQTPSIEDRSSEGFNPTTGERTIIPPVFELQDERDEMREMPAEPGRRPVNSNSGNRTTVPLFLEEYIEVHEGSKAKQLATATRPGPLLNTLRFPWQTIFKLLMRFEVNGRDFFYSCSAAAVDEFHLITAGHCMFNHDPNRDGSNRDATWASEVWAWAAQTDRIDPLDVPDFPYGVAKATYLRSYTAWTQNQNLDHDWGVITLDRRVGNYTGWMGYETSTNVPTLNFSGYPTETPHVPSGNLLQYPGGNRNNVENYSTFVITMDAFTYGGHSGGPVWRYDEDADGRWIQGVNSTSNRVGRANANRLTDDKFDDLILFIRDDENERPPSRRAELIEYAFDTDAKELFTNSARQGGSFRVKYNVFNVGFRRSGSIQVDFYLSANTTISTNDRLVGTQTISNLNSFTFSNPTATLDVPRNLAPGTYYVGWIMSHRGSEYNTDNNTAVITEERLRVRSAR